MRFKASSIKVYPMVRESPADNWTTSLQDVPALTRTVVEDSF